MKKVLKILIVLLVLVHLVGCQKEEKDNLKSDVTSMNSNSFEEEISQSGKSENDFTTSNLEDFEIEINDNEVSVLKYVGNDKNVAIPNTFYGHTVTSVDGWMFANNKVDSVIIPNTVVKITHIDSGFKNGSYDNKKIKVIFEKSDMVASPDDFEYSINGGGVIIKAYKGKSSNVCIPTEIDGIPVIELGENIFNKEKNNYQADILNVTIPETITTVHYKTFSYLYNVTSLSLPTSIVNIIDRPDNPLYGIDGVMFNYSTLNTFTASEKMIDEFKKEFELYSNAYSNSGFVKNFDYYTEVVD